MEDPCAVFQSAAIGVVASENAVPGGCTNGRRRMSVSEEHPVGGELLEIGEGDLAVCIVRPAITISHVIH